MDQQTIWQSIETLINDEKNLLNTSKLKSKILEYAECCKKSALDSTHNAMLAQCADLRRDRDRLRDKLLAKELEKDSLSSVIEKINKRTEEKIEELEVEIFEAEDNLIKFFMFELSPEKYNFLQRNIQKIIEKNTEVKNLENELQLKLIKIGANKMNDLVSILEQMENL